MPRNGSGQYDLPYDWNDDKANGIKVLASRMQDQDQDIANALTGSLSSDGQTPLTGDLDFNGNKCVDLADGSDPADSVNVSQVQTGEFQFFGVSTTTPAGTNGLNYDLGPTPSITVYPDYVNFSFVCHFTCIDNPNMRFGSLSTKTLKKSNGSGGYTALEAGDMVANKEYFGILNADINAADIIIENVENNNTSLSVQSGTSQARTIATGAITIKSNFSSYTVDTESSAATDDLDTITGGKTGQVIFLNTANNSRDVTLRSGVGNIVNPTGLNLTLGNTNDVCCLRYNGTNWIVQYFNYADEEPIRFIEAKTASASTSLTFTSGINSSFTAYEIEFDNLLPATNNVWLGLRFTTDGGSSWISTSYESLSNAQTLGAVTPAGFASVTNAIQISSADTGGTRTISNNANYAGISGRIRISNPSSSVYKKVISQSSYDDASNNFSNVSSAGVYTGATTTINGFQLIMSSGNITSGSARLYGIK